MPPRPSGVWMAVVLTFALGALAPEEARADDKAVCIAAHEDAQRLRLGNHLMAAREKLRTCSIDACPGAIRADCEKWLGEVLENLPSMVLSVRDRKGKDMFDVRVLMDGKPQPSALSGAALDLDPGPHTFTFEHPSGTREERVLVRQAEHNRIFTVTLGPLPGEPSPSPPPPSEPPPTTLGARRITALVLAGVGGVGLGVAGVLGLTSNGDASALRDTCGVTRSCAQDDVDAIAGRRTAAGALAGVGSAMLIAGAVLFFTGQTTEPRSTSAKPRVRIAAWPLATGGASAVFSGQF